MAKIPTDEAMAKYILLQVFVNHFNRRPGEVLGLQNLMVSVTKFGQRSDDVTRGLKYCVKQGWLEYEDQAEHYRLTEAGFKVA